VLPRTNPVLQSVDGISNYILLRVTKHIINERACRSILWLDCESSTLDLGLGLANKTGSLDGKTDVATLLILVSVLILP
jgi:hypothetical protein